MKAQSKSGGRRHQYVTVLKKTFSQINEAEERQSPIFTVDKVSV